MARLDTACREESQSVARVKFSATRQKRTLPSRQANGGQRRKTAAARQAEGQPGTVLLGEGLSDESSGRPAA